MNFAALFKAFDTAVAISEFARRVASPPPSPPSSSGTTPADREELTPTVTSRLAGHLEARLTNVVVAALKEAFERDHARLELERIQMEESRRRAEEAMRLELRRQAVDRELGRLRLLAGAALTGWVASIAMLVVRLDAATTVSRVVLAGGWLLLLGALVAAFMAQVRVGADARASTDVVPGAAASAAIWLLTAGLAATAVSLLV